ncbi:hypothetical protein H696_04527 [Fonticula alba]|uniref:Synembryn-A n=1 Tax=Fonticula alba TaxID=691883 RepID=A0A058Z4Q6_FONAL|nr:hypothetical protein H696_04527 [Fonticula alba]KCV69111.1 hypothetical protein H696_04527 [Fonticula alba]|eukprot:XP_009496682.1 hypothetical protein H696_04527 [Fonticula alba]
MSAIIQSLEKIVALSPPVKWSSSALWLEVDSPMKTATAVAQLAERLVAQLDADMDFDLEATPRAPELARGAGFTLLWALHVMTPDKAAEDEPLGSDELAILAAMRYLSRSREFTEALRSVSVPIPSPRPNVHPLAVMNRPLALGHPGALAFLNNVLHGCSESTRMKLSVLYHTGAERHLRALLANHRAIAEANRPRTLLAVARCLNLALMQLPASIRWGYPEDVTPPAPAADPVAPLSDTLLSTVYVLGSMSLLNDVSKTCIFLMEESAGLHPEDHRQSDIWAALGDLMRLASTLVRHHTRLRAERSAFFVNGPEQHQLWRPHRQALASVVGLAVAAAAMLRRPCLGASAPTAATIDAFVSVPMVADMLDSCVLDALVLLLLPSRPFARRVLQAPPSETLGLAPAQAAALGLSRLDAEARDPAARRDFLGIGQDMTDLLSEVLAAGLAHRLAVAGLAVPCSPESMPANDVDLVEAGIAMALVTSVCRVSDGVCRTLRRKWILPLDSSRAVKPEKQQTLRGSLARILTLTGIDSSTRSLMNLTFEFIWVLCCQSAKAVVAHFGHGNAAGMLANKALIPEDASDEEDDLEPIQFGDRPLRLYAKGLDFAAEVLPDEEILDVIDHVSGTSRSETPRPARAPMSTAEMEELSNMMTRLEAMGMVKNPTDDYRDD